MKIEDAVTIIKDVCKEDYKNTVVREALDMAIDALEKMREDEHDADGSD